jgi:predicted AlkP superfamily pyrophosphatase or phosphodiesterase
MPQRLCLIDIPGLSKDLLAYVPPDSAFGKWLANQTVATLKPSWPAVTCSVQATLTTGVSPNQHGIIANGIATFRSAADQELVDDSNFANYRKQVSFWEQSNQFVQVPRFWQDSAGKSRFKTALLFFQNSMPGFHGPPKPAADIVLTPKPDHGPDGKLVSLCWSNPPELVPQLFKELGPFPLMNYWGPMAGVASSIWVARGAAMVWKLHQPQLQLVYVPHLDYDLQRFGPDSPQAKKAVVDLTGAIEPLFTTILADGGQIVVLSEYSIAAVHQSIAPNRLLKQAGLLVTRETADGILIDYEKSEAFAMVDHQIAHQFVRSSDAKARVEKLFSSEAVTVVDIANQITHARAGDIQLQANAGYWFDYRWWENAGAAPKFAGTVDIHRKPGYDPLELFFDPATRSVISDASRIRGSHGATPGSDGVCIMASATAISEIQAVDVSSHILKMIG